VLVRFTAGFHFGKFLLQNSVLTFDKPPNDFALRGYSVSVKPLSVGADAIVTNVFSLHGHLDTSRSRQVNQELKKSIRWQRVDKTAENR
jgi:predicted acyltransferase (DUF342 family)